MFSVFMQATGFTLYIIVNVFFLLCKTQNWGTGTQRLRHPTLIDFAIWMQFHTLQLHPVHFCLMSPLS